MSWKITANFTPYLSPFHSFCVMKDRLGEMIAYSSSWKNMCDFEQINIFLNNNVLVFNCANWMVNGLGERAE